MPSLDEPLAKLEWANKSLKRLQSEMGNFMASNPYAIMVHKNPQEGISFLRLRILKPLPSDFSLLIGDFIQNLRTSLDYLVWQLSLLTKPELDRLPANERPVNQVEFPIFTKAIEDAINRRLQLVPSQARDEIKALQPYHRGDRAYEDWLAVLHNLSNRDKHRQLTPIGMLIRETFTPDGRFTGFREWVVPFQDGAMITMLPTELIDKYERDFKMRTAFEILLDKGGPPGGVRMPSLNNLHDYIRDVVFPKFSCFFS
jgi:hypothetical protein